MRKVVAVSACLLGVNCRYNGKNKLMKNLEDFLEKYIPIPICPEQLGGLPTPRPPASFYGGDGRSVLSGEAKIIDEEGEDITDKIINGCNISLYLIRLLGISTVVLKDRSPACGVERIWMGKDCVEGVGVLKALLESENIKVIKGDNL